MSARQRRLKQNRQNRGRAQRRRLIAAGGLTAGATLAMSGVAQAAPMTFTVGSLDDTTGATDCADATNIDCTLRQAIIDANANDGADTIVFRSGLTGTITLTANPEVITEALAVQGPGAGEITVDGDQVHRTFYVNPTTAADPVSISGLTLTRGRSPYPGDTYGGAIYNDDGDLTISNAVISDSYATRGGGGIYTRVGPLRIDHSTVSGNYSYNGGGVYSREGELAITSSTVHDNDAGLTSDGFGGGVMVSAADTTVTNSTVDANKAGDDGGGLYSSGGGHSLTVVNSTIANNHAVTDDGGGIYFRGNDPAETLTVTSSTITGNTAQTAAGGIQIGYAGLDGTLQNSIVSGNTATQQPDTDDLKSNDGNGYYFDTAFSLIGKPSTYVNETVPGSNIIGVDPQLGILADNGGPTRTQLPTTTSPVVNQGSAFGLTTDQRELTRPVAFPGVPNSTAAGADGSDMGAVELQLPPTPPPQPPQPAQPGPTGQQTGAIKKCKKKFKGKAKAKKRKKCIKKAKKLPV